MSDIQSIQGDARHLPIADESVQCIVTSPPYWGLRKYSGEQELVWGGVEGCEHEWQTTTTITNNNGLGDSTLTGGRGVSAQGGGGGTLSVGTCLLCGAWRGAFGLEPTIGMYIEHTVTIMRECRRVLRKDGVLFWNIGDSYASVGRSPKHESPGVGATQEMPRIERDLEWRAGGGHNFSWTLPGNVKPKDLCLIPSRVALAAQADGWWVRSMIIWAKPNPMPESVTDRPTDAYEHIIMLTKSARYYWDADAVREKGSGQKAGNRNYKYAGLPGHETKQGIVAVADVPWNERNIRNVWTFATQPYKEAHFATFPEELPRRCIMAASKVGDTILDPFAGSGTVGRVAVELNRNAILNDLAYYNLSEKRTRNVQRVLI